MGALKEPGVACLGRQRPQINDQSLTDDTSVQLLRDCPKTGLAGDGTTRRWCADGNIGCAGDGGRQEYRETNEDRNLHVVFAMAAWASESAIACLTRLSRPTCAESSSQRVGAPSAQLGPGTARTACSACRTAAGSACRRAARRHPARRHQLHERGLRVQRRQLRPCDRLREVRTEPAHCRARLATRRWWGGSAQLRETRTACEGCGRHDALSAALRRRELGGDLSVLGACHYPASVAGADWREPGSDRRQSRPSGQWLQGSCLLKTSCGSPDGVVWWRHHRAATGSVVG